MNNISYDLIETDLQCEAFENLLNCSFPVKKNTSFFDDFPIWKGNHHFPLFKVGAFDKGQLVSCAAIVLRELKIGYSRVKVAVIGAVATDSNYRGQGLASHCVQFLQKYADDHQVGVIFLWGSEHGMYNKLGFDLCGLQFRVPLNKALNPEKSYIKDENWNDQIIELMKSRKSGFEIGIGNEQWLQSHKNVNWWVAKKEETVCGFIAFDRGIDLQNIVHEWGGDPDAIAFLLNELSQIRLESQIIGNREELESLQISLSQGIEEYICMAQVLDPGPLVSAISKGEKKIEIQKQGDQWIFKLADQELRIDPFHLSQIIFGPTSYKELKDTPLPFSLWAWGLDAG
ncbi:MAG: hypothetical protein CL678_09800 [Bdellovibrionaceae bacterium]|nr:hypothetical protein [Pseudobdellovibrionaceae bacterium]|tara:strand:+ start:330 stop:1358 length:1029 start_codon:yes stop_codon:yes gene_type:complete